MQGGPTTTCRPNPPLRSRAVEIITTSLLMISCVLS
jgi:hypothetical protein